MIELLIVVVDVVGEWEAKVSRCLLYLHPSNGPISREDRRNAGKLGRREEMRKNLVRRYSNRDLSEGNTEKRAKSNQERENTLDLTNENYMQDERERWRDPESASSTTHLFVRFAVDGRKQRAPPTPAPLWL
jgi:hypothetical protein